MSMNLPTVQRSKPGRQSLAGKRHGGLLFCCPRDTLTVGALLIIMACHLLYILLKYQPKLQALAVEAVEGQNGFILCNMTQKLPEIRPDWPKSAIPIPDGRSPQKAENSCAD